MRGSPLARRAICRALAGRSDAPLWAGLSASDWDDLGRIACSEGVGPLLCHTLDRGGWPEAMPSAVRDDLKSVRYAAAAQSMLLRRALLQAVEILSQPPSIPLLFLKGTALGVTLYPDPALRPMGDVDALVPRDRLDDAVARLRENGYHPVIPEMAHGLTRLAGHHVHLESPDTPPIHLELHWTLARSEHERHAPDMGWFWGQSQPFDLDVPGVGSRSAPHGSSYPALTLNPAAHLLYLAAHLMLHHGAARAQLLWFYDVHLMVERERERIDWEELVRRARQFHWATALAAALQAAQDRFGTALPEGVLASLVRGDDGQGGWLVRRRAAPLQTRATSLFARVASLDWPTRLRLIRSILLPRPAYVRWRYKPCPSWLWPLYYPYRWGDIVWEGARTLWRMARSTNAPDR